jgi:tetratricopeptide (TPR) repeat protein
MAANLTTSTELFHRFHTCELYVKQGKIASCLISFKQIIENLNAVPLTDKEKKEFNEDVDAFLQHLSEHKKFKEIFGEFSFQDTDLKTNLEFMRSMITAQEQEIVQRIEKDEEAAEAKRIETEQMEQKGKEELQQKIDESIKLIDEGRLPEAIEIIGNSEDIKDAVILHFNDLGMQLREAKDFARACKSYSAALFLSPQDENLHYNLGRVFYESGQLDKAEECLDKAMKISPDFKEGRLFYDYLLKLGQTRRSGTGDSGAEKRQGAFMRKILSFGRNNTPADRHKNQNFLLGPFSSSVSTIFHPLRRLIWRKQS